MVATLTKQGDSYALILSAAFLKETNINPEAPLQIKSSNNSFTVEPADDADDEALFVKALEETHREYGRVLKKLAE